MMILIEPDELHTESCQRWGDKKKRGSARMCSREVGKWTLKKKYMRNWDLIGWAGMHEFIVKHFHESFRCSLCNYDGLWLNENMNEEFVHMLVCWIIGFPWRFTVGGESRWERWYAFNAINGSCRRMSFGLFYLCVKSDYDYSFIETLSIMHCVTTIRLITATSSVLSLLWFINAMEIDKF